jgi:hypothetical protein
MSFVRFLENLKPAMVDLLNQAFDTGPAPPAGQGTDGPALAKPTPVLLKALSVISNFSFYFSK